MTLPLHNAQVSSVFCLICLAGLCLYAQSAQLQQYFKEGENALAEHRYADAERAYEKVASLDPSSPEAHARLGMIYFDDRKFEQAVPPLRQSLKLKPNQPAISAFLAISLSELGQFKDALPALEKCFRTANDSALKRLAGLQLERTYSGLRRDSEAVQIALELAKLYPNDPEILYHGGRLFGSMAYSSFQRLAAVAPDSSWKLQASGEAFESQGNFELAAAEYREVLKTNPNRPGVHYRLGRVLLARSAQTHSAPDLVDQSASEFEAELRLDPSNANAAYELAEISRKTGQFDKAAKFFVSALEHYPDFQEAELGLGRVLAASGKPEQALPHLRKAVALNPQDAVAFYQLSQAEKAAGNEVGQKRAVAEFLRLRSQSKQLEPATEITPQTLDAGAEIPPP